MTHGLNQEQLSHLKSLDSKKKKRKFLLDCMLENIDLEISNFFSKDYIKNESQEIIDKSNESQPPMNFCVEIDSHNRGVLETAYTGFSTGKPVHFRAKYLHSNSLNTYMSTSDLIQESLLVTTNEFLTYIGREDLIEKNIDKQVKYINESKLPKWKFKEEYIDNENHLCFIYNHLIGLGENPNFDYMIKLKEIALNYSEPKQEENPEISQSEVNEILVVDFENVSQKENPQ